LDPGRESDSKVILGIFLKEKSFTSVFKTEKPKGNFSIINFVGNSLLTPHGKLAIHFQFGTN
jgi:hypothetical protein